MPEVEHRRPGAGGRRWYDSRWYRRVRDVWLLVVTGVTVVALWHAQDATNQVQAGRRVGQGITCAVLSSLSEAGKAVIGSSTLSVETPFTRFLEAHGYPPLRVRRAQARRQGNAYVASISRNVQALVGHVGDGLVRRDGTINCRRFSALARIPPLR